LETGVEDGTDDTSFGGWSGFENGDVRVDEEDRTTRRAEDESWELELPIVLKLARRTGIRTKMVIMAPKPRGRE